MKFRYVAAWLLIVVGWAGVGLADDVHIFGTQSVTIEPNVMILYDTSGSMLYDVNGTSYNMYHTYSGTYVKKKVYKYNSIKKTWSDYAASYRDLKCGTVEDALREQGHYVSYKNNDAACSLGSRIELYTGNYRNYSTGIVRRETVAKAVINDLLESTTGVRFGLMKFNPNYGDGGSTNDNEGGSVVAKCGTSNEEISGLLDSLISDGGTPLAETLAEAGLYFAGFKGYFANKTEKYKSPIEYHCQKNYVIVFTDGEPSVDDNAILTTEGKYMGKTIGDLDSDGTSGTLADVAKFLHDKDMNADNVGTQSITTYTIGFTTDQDLLENTAKHGGGSYYKADNADSLKKAFDEIMSSIAEESSTFAAPAVPVNPTTRTAGAEYIYLPFFKPTKSGDWLGNLKKYKLSDTGNILDVSGKPILADDGSFKADTRSYWSSVDDGDDFLKGGAGAYIKKQSSRKFYTSLGTEKDLTDSSNLFDAGNDALIKRGVSAALIDKVKEGRGKWPMGAIIHSEPAVVYYPNSGKSVIFVGSNDGLFRAIHEKTGKELWAFVPPGQLDRLARVEDTNYDYYVDGPPAIAYGDLYPGSTSFKPETLLVGERRGGNRYYALDIQSFDTPKLEYVVEPSLLAGETLGQSWGKPSVCRVKLNSSVEDEAQVFVLPGGYDPQQDAAKPAATDSKGRAIYAIKVSDGTLAGLNFNRGNWDKMTHSIVDLYAIDSDADGITTRVYAGDMGGHVFVVADDKEVKTVGSDKVVDSKEPDGTWGYKNLLFECVSGKLFYAPVPTDVSGVETLFFGTGDRANPLGTESNRFYAVRNNWVDKEMTDADLVDISNQTVDFTASLKVKKGWYLKLPHPNEKVISKAIVYSSVVYFTTYTPDSGSSSTSGDDLCAQIGARGVERLYAVCVVDGSAVTNWGKDKVARSIVITGGASMAGATFNNGGINVWPQRFDAAKNDRTKQFYWNRKW